MCHAINLFFEARGEPPVGRTWVLDVVMNRRDDARYPSSICDVIKQRHGFTWYTDWKSILPVDEYRWLGTIQSMYTDDPVEVLSLWKCYYEARVHYLYGSPLSNSTHYLTTDLKETGEVGWSYKGTISAVIGRHTFLSNVP